MTARCLCLCSLATISLAGLAACGAAPPGEQGPRVGIIITDDAAGAAALRGAELGAAEAAHAATLLGESFALVVRKVESGERVGEVAQDLRKEGVVAILGGFDERSCNALASVAERDALLFLNLGCRSDALRRRPGGMTFHVEASDSMYAAAAAGAGGTPGGDPLPVLWHAGLSRYGAAQLNERFERRTGAGADAFAWAGWMAVKIVWEAYLERRSTDPVALASFLRSGSASFDGHKGEELRFDPQTHQLTQPLHLPVEGTESPPRAGGGSIQRRPGSVPLEGRRYAFVSNEGSEDVSVIDLDTHTVVSRIPVPARPRGIHVGPGGARVFVALSDQAATQQGDNDAIVAISSESGAVVASHDAGSDPEQFGLSPDGRFLYAANEDAGTASITDLETGRLLRTLVVGIEPEGVGVSPDGRWVYVAAETSNTVSVIDTEAREIVASFLVDVRPRGVAFSPAQPRAYITNEISGTLSVVDTRSHQPIASVTLADGEAKPVGVAVSPDGARVYVANGHGHSVSVVDAESHRIIAEVPVGRRPWGIAISRDGQRIYTANGGSNDVSVIDAGSLRVIHTVPVGQRPWGIAVLER